MFKLIYNNRVTAIIAALVVWMLIFNAFFAKRIDILSVPADQIIECVSDEAINNPTILVTCELRRQQ